MTNWQQEADQYLIERDYSKAVNLYEQAIEAEPDVRSHYWHLGLLLLLQGQETEAQMTWLLAMTEGTPEQLEVWTVELMQMLHQEATRQEALINDSVAWAIRQHMREIIPTDINNLLHLINLAIKLNTFIGEELTSLGIIELLKSEKLVSLDVDLLLQVLQRILDEMPWPPAAMEFAQACIAHVQEPISFILILLPASIKIAYTKKCPGLAARFLELCLPLETEKTEVLRHMAAFYQNAGNYSKGIETAKLCYSISEILIEKVNAIYLVMRGLMGAGGYWEEVYVVLEQQESLLLSLIEEEAMVSNQAIAQRLFNSTIFFPYLRDDPKNNRHIHNQVSRLAQVNVQNNARNQVERYCQIGVTGRTTPLKIGYVSHCFCGHSVGWLARGVFRYHDRERFKIHAYFISYKEGNDPLQDWYLQQVDRAYKGGIYGDEIAEQIYKDEIDILIDLDSLTLDVSCEIVALKPAPVQVTWLGWDASGIPTIDYFIADPYVLPDSAQEYYTEKIWRLPYTYIAVDGFELGVPTLRRDQLDIPSDAVVYMSTQIGYKRHPDTVRLQMKIIKEVPNSYFLIKGPADQEAIEKFFIQIAEEEGVNSDSLRFLPQVALESTHRANLAIADIVLDTYPYNGATTTMETLWMGIPIVTRVGQQFAARNSYTMMMNVGVTEGIAWTDEEYVEWGIRLGKDEALRQQVVWKLRQSRHTSPLWNAKQFTREMENAYQQMWQRYVDTSG
ncbi:O-linked N-acetylglucosamine transferase, SPINDLY family protein [Limnofasciculus baicalensis]|uniref:O-linked N-acetylglucosamine transferase, SPINDLY family protein n=1 Tax=Limnofasciculus baicalensis BBK-W-15 TaxID=2699891 RepID=A0AAE3GTE6_9CYAN|nr:O-linked N-acetylglucosamine transferase, SPINDLY family protein [Limnofasciculus baicalensis]MCP2728212.1 O-linked N-acetylglucosamine transferase, SPINDLY family protein [Limnofasciculus baicalensis BBK-W-15]